MAAAAAQDDLAKGDFDKYASRYHPEALESFKKMMLPIFELAAQDTSGESGTAQIFGQAFKDLEEVRRMSPEKFFSSVFRVLMGSTPSMKDALAGAKVESLGYVAEADLAHVVTRMKVSMMGMSVTKLTVVTMKKQGDDWKMMLSGDIEGMANAMKMSAEMRKQ